MSKSVKPTPPMAAALVSGRLRRALPETGAAEPKPLQVPGQRAGVSRIPSENPIAEQARVDARKWAEKRNKRGAK
ncbi:MAG TPA: hypothetical protein VF648_09765 [Pyrinomonadaceae bacterium]|jgi:hypothetical protein